MYWEPAESGSQQAVGRSGWLLACFCQHANEVITGMYKVVLLLLYIFYCTERGTLPNFRPALYYNNIGSKCK